MSSFNPQQFFLWSRYTSRQSALQYHSFWIQLISVPLVCGFCNHLWECAPQVALWYLWVIYFLWTVTTPSTSPPPLCLTGPSGLLRCSSWFRGMSQLPQQGVKRAAEENKSWVYEWLATTCFISRLDDSITGYVGHMVPPVTVKLISCESYQQRGKWLGGAQKVLTNCTYWVGFLMSIWNWTFCTYTNILFFKKSVYWRKPSSQIKVLINAAPHLQLCLQSFRVSVPL